MNEIQSTYRCEITSILEVNNDRDPKRNKVGNAAIVHKILARVQLWRLDLEVEIVKPYDVPIHFSQEKGIVIETFK